MPTLQREIGYEGAIRTAPVESVGVEFDVPIYEYIDQGAAGPEVIRRHITGETTTLRLLQPLASDTYQLTIPDSLVVPEDETMRSRFGLHYMQARAERRLDELTSTVPVRYYAEPGPLIGQATIELLYIPDLEPFAGLEDDVAGTSLLLTTFLAVNKRAYEELVNRLAASLIEIDAIVLLDVVSYLTELTDGAPALLKRTSPRIKQWIIELLLRSGVAEADRAYELIRSEIRQLYEFTLLIPKMKPVEIGGRFALVPADASTVSETDFSFYHLSAEFLTMAGPALHVSRHDFERPLQVEHNAVTFSLSKGAPIFQGAVTTPIVINVKAFDGSVVWTREYEADDEALAALEIEVPLRRPSVLDPLPAGADTEAAKKLRGQVLDIDKKCPVKDLTVLVQARSDAAAIWRVVGAATTDGSGNFSMPYPYGVFTEAEALVSLAPDAPAAIPIVAGEDPKQTISDDFLYLVVRDVECPHVEGDPDCDCDGPKKASRLPDYADLIGSDEYSQDIGGACVNLSSPNRTLSEFSYQGVVRTSDPDVANYTLKRSDDGSRYDLVGAGQKRARKVVDLDNPVAWQDAPEDQRNLSFYQAVTIATGHILHYRSLFKADGYSLGDLVYSLALAPGQKKEIVVFDSSHSLVGAESQSLSQGERLAAGLTNEREITSTLGGGISETLRGSSSANTSGISAGLGVGAILGPVGGVLGVSGGVANSNSSASQDSSRGVSQAFGEMLRQSILQNAEGYRQLNASVVTTVQEGQRYGVTSEVVANHNHCHALTMMYFEVLRHYAIYQELSSVEECVFLPLLMTNFTRENIYKWRDVLAPSLLPMPSDTYLQPLGLTAGRAREHPLVKAFDANERIKTAYARIDFPAGAYDDERIQFVKGNLLLRADLPRPRTRYDRIRSLPVTTKTVTTTEIDPIATAKAAVHDSIAAGLTGGLSLLFSGPPGTNIQYNTKETQVLVKQAIFDAFMTMDANYQSVPPAQCIRVTNFEPTSITFGPITVPVAGLDFFLDGIIDRALWTAYAKLLGYTDVLRMLDYYFKGRLISEWDSIFYNDLAPIIFEKIVNSLGLTSINTDFTSSVKYKGGERRMRLDVNGSTNLKRNELPLQLELSSSSADAKALREFVTLTIESLNLSYSTSHFNGTLFSGSTNDDLLDGTTLFIPESADEKRNPRTDDAYLAYKLIEHLNSNLEYYNKVLWYRLDPDRRYMLLDGFNIEVFDDDGLSAGRRSVASVVKNSLVTITGNSLVFPVAPGYRVSQSYLVREPSEPPPDDAPARKLLDHYQPLTPIEPYRISVPSKGVFAEAIQGACNACEKLENDRLQDWSRFPNLDEPTSISPITTPTPGITDWKAAFAEFASPMVNIQNAPAAPAPGAGLAGLAELLGKSGVFDDVTGLDANQQNVLKTYLSNQENAKALAQMASGMAMQAHNTQNSGRIMDSLKAAKDGGALSSTEYGKLVSDHLQQQIDGGQTKRAELKQQEQANPSLTKAAVDAATQDKNVKAHKVDEKGNLESVEISKGAPQTVLARAFGVVPPLRQDPKKGNDCWAVCATMLMSWKTGASMTVDDVMLRAGARYTKLYNDNTGLPAADKDDLVARLEMVAEPPASYGLEQYVAWIKAFGPLWVTTDAAEDTAVFSPHARILTRITGSVDDASARLTFLDPATGGEATSTFADFVARFEQTVTENKSEHLFLQVVHFADRVDGAAEGFHFEGPWTIHEPIHEHVTLAALVHSSLKVPATEVIGRNQALNEFARGVIWNDDPEILMFHDHAADVADNWRFSKGLSWGNRFKKGERSKSNDLKNLTARSHFWDLSFLHAMATDVGESPHDTLAKVLLWAETMYRLSIGEGVSAKDRLAAVPVSSNVKSNGTTFTYSLGKFFGPATVPRGTDTLNYLLTRDTINLSLDISRRAIGSLLHLVQDSYARGHVRRTLLNPGDLKAGSQSEFKAGKWGRYGEVENFHCYRGQDAGQHKEFDTTDASALDLADLKTFNGLIGARDAIDNSAKVLDLWKAKKPWAAGPKQLFEDEIFKLSATASPADTNVN